MPPRKTYHLPLRIVSDSITGQQAINALTPGKAGGEWNTFATLRAAGGVCLDIRRRVPDCKVMDGRGVVIPESEWRDPIIAMRTGAQMVRA